jgi:predicted nucleic acid-binding protein
MFVLDINVVSEIRKIRLGRAAPNVAVWPDPRGEQDALIAATALVHGMTMITRNTRDFSPTGIGLLNPWDGSASNE